MWRPWWLWKQERERWYGWVGHGASWRLKNRYIKIPLLWVDADDDACPGHRRYAHFTTGKQVIYVPRWCSQCGPRATSLISQAEQARTMFQKLLLPTSNNVLGVLWKTKGNSDKSLSKFVFTHTASSKNILAHVVCSWGHWHATVQVLKNHKNNIVKEFAITVFSWKRKKIYSLC